MNRKCNLAVVCDIRENIPVGVICSCPFTGDIAYTTEDDMLMESLDIILDNKLFLLNKEKIDGKNMIREETVNAFDSYYITAINYALPFPWKILGVTTENGDVEEIANEAYAKIKKGEK